MSAATDTDHEAGRSDALAERRDEDRYAASLAYRDGWKSGEQERWLAAEDSPARRLAAASIARVADDAKMAESLVLAVRPPLDEEAMYEAESLIYDRLGVSEDDTFAGPTAEATARVERFVSETLRREWTYAGWSS